MPFFVQVNAQLKYMGLAAFAPSQTLPAQHVVRVSQVPLSGRVFIIFVRRLRLIWYLYPLSVAGKKFTSKGKYRSGQQSRTGLTGFVRSKLSKLTALLIQNAVTCRFFFLLHFSGFLWFLLHFELRAPATGLQNGFGISRGCNHFAKSSSGGDANT